MRKQKYFAALAAVGALVCSCQREVFVENGYEVESGAISFVIKGIETRSETMSTVLNNTYTIGTDNDGHMFSLNETVTWMDGVGSAPVTKGTPAYTENLMNVHGTTFSGVAYGTDGQVVNDGVFEIMGDGNRWRRELGFNPFETSDPLTFYLRMPASATGLSNLTYSNGSIEFDYTTPPTAAEQQDILFATRTLSEEDYTTETSSNGGASILFRHALTGVKFALNSARNSATPDDTEPAGEVQTFITKVVFKGLKDSGHAVFTPDNSDEEKEDDTDVFSSRSSFTWTDTDATNRTSTFTQTYNATDIQDFESGDAVGAPSSFYAAGAHRNLNDPNASLTFWFIPQDITADLELEVTFYVWNGQSAGEEVTLTLDLGKRILEQSSTTNKSWLAGQLRTFTIDPTTVDVVIDDELDDDKLTKSNVSIVNTGNKDEYIRVAMVGNWVDKSTGEILLGTVDQEHDTFTPFTPWDESQGEFKDFPGYLSNDAKWVKGDDGFYYFTAAVEPGKEPSVPLFSSYRRNATPPFEDAGFVMELIVQAIDADAGSSYSAAWATVL